MRAHPGRILAVYIREVRLDPGDGRVEAVSDSWDHDVPFVLAADTRRRTTARRRRSGCCDRPSPAARRGRAVAAAPQPPRPRRVRSSATAAAGPPGRCTGCCARSSRRSTSSRRTRCSSGSTTGRSSRARAGLPGVQGRARREGSRAGRPARARRRPARRARAAHRHAGRAWRPTTSTRPRRPGPSARGGTACSITSDRDAFAHISDHTQVLRLINGGITGSPLLNPARLHAMYGVAAGALPGVRRAPRRRQRQPAGRARDRREDRAGPAVPDGLDAGGLGRHRALRRRQPRGHARLLLRGGGPAPDRCRPAEAARRRRGPGAVRVQPVDDVGAHRPRPRPDARRARAARACCRSTRTGSRGWSATSGSRRRRTWRCGCSPSRRLSVTNPAAAR